jgi:hypothetical protein
MINREAIKKRGNGGQNGGRFPATFGHMPSGFDSGFSKPMQAGIAMGSDYLAEKPN